METQADILLSLIDELQRIDRLLRAHVEQNHALAVITRESVSASWTRMEKNGKELRSALRVPAGKAPFDGR